MKMVFPEVSLIIGGISMKNIMRGTVTEGTHGIGIPKP